MSLALTQSKTALAAGLTASFLGVGGTEPFVYSVLPNGAGGTIDASTGIYTAPAIPAALSDPQPDNAAQFFDTIQVQDSLGATALAKIMVGTPFMLFCEIIQQEMGLADGRVYLWDQKIFQPKDFGLYIAVANSDCRPFGNTITPDPTTGWDNPIQAINMMAVMDIDVISRGPAARDRKEEVLMALNSIYSEQQQEGNSFQIAKLPATSRFHNLSEIDGAAIPYRYRISVNMQYTVTKTKATPYMDTFQEPQVVVDNS